MSLEILAEAALGFPNDQPVAVTQKVPCHVRASVFSPCEGGGGGCHHFYPHFIPKEPRL